MKVPNFLWRNNILDILPRLQRFPLSLQPLIEELRRSLIWTLECITRNVTNVCN